MNFLKKPSKPQNAKLMVLFLATMMITQSAHAAMMTDFMQENTGIMRVGFAIIALYCLNEIVEPFLKGGEISKPLLKIVGACVGIGISISPDTFIGVLKGWGL